MAELNRVDTLGGFPPAGFFPSRTTSLAAIGEDPASMRLAPHSG